MYSLWSPKKDRLQVQDWYFGIIQYNLKFVFIRLFPILTCYMKEVAVVALHVHIGNQLHIPTALPKHGSKKMRAIMQILCKEAAFCAY